MILERRFSETRHQRFDPTNYERYGTADPGYCRITLPGQYPTRCWTGHLDVLINRTFHVLTTDLWTELDSAQRIM